MRVCAWSSATFLHVVRRPACIDMLHSVPVLPIRKIRNLMCRAPEPPGGPLGLKTDKSSNILSHNLVKMQNISDMITGCQPLIEHACNEIKSKITESVLHTILKISMLYGIVSDMIYSHSWVICG